ncbi:MAG: glycosyltransferase [Moraxella sp.]|nr:glycosyltransferase [Moraxella sp.]
MMDTSVLVTVYMPTYNRASLLPRAIESVLNQTYQNIELIVVDDCSQDNTAEILAGFAKQDNRVRYFIQEKNSGACACRNKAIKEASGKFITGLDDDDYFLPHRVEDFVYYWDKLEENKSCLFSTIKYNQDGVEVAGGVSRYIRKKMYVQQKDMLTRNHLGNQVFAKTEDLLKIGGFDESMKIWQDFECFYRLLSLEKAILIDNKSYIIDQRHGFNRISASKINILYDTYLYFCNKHKLNYLEKKILKESLVFYDKSFADLTSSILNFIYHPNKISLKNIIFFGRSFL